MVLVNNCSCKLFFFLSTVISSYFRYYERQTKYLSSLSIYSSPGATLTSIPRGLLSTPDCMSVVCQSVREDWQFLQRHQQQVDHLQREEGRHTSKVTPRELQFQRRRLASRRSRANARRPNLNENVWNRIQVFRMNNRTTSCPGEGRRYGGLAVLIFRFRSKMQNKLDCRRTTAHALFPPVRPTEWDSTAAGTLKEFHLPRRPSEGNTNYFPFLGFQ